MIFSSNVDSIGNDDNLIYILDVNSLIYTISNSKQLLSIVYTRGESPQDRLRDVQTYRITLASAYVLYHLSTIWLQLQIRGRSSRWE